MPADDPIAPLVELTVHVVRGDWSALANLRARREPDRRFREALLQLHLFVGFPTVVEAFARLDRAGGVGAFEPDEEPCEPDRPDRGRELFARIYGANAERVERVLAQAHPQLHAWVLGHAYGRVLTRGGLSARDRELLAVVALALRGPQRQLLSHLRGARACGAVAADIDALEELLERFDAPGRAALAEARSQLARSGH